MWKIFVIWSNYYYWIESILKTVHSVKAVAVSIPPSSWVDSTVQVSPYLSPRRVWDKRNSFDPTTPFSQCSIRSSPIWSNLCWKSFPKLATTILRYWKDNFCLSFWGKIHNITKNYEIITTKLLDTAISPFRSFQNKLSRPI